MALNTFLGCTGSVVGWYGLLAPEIIEVLEASPSKPSVSSLFLMLSSFISTSRPDIRAGSGLKWTAVPWSSEDSRAENNVSTMNNPRYKTITVNSSRVYDLQHYIHLSVLSSPTPAVALCSDPVGNSAERSRTITAVLMAVSIFHSFWMQNVMLLRVSALKLHSCEDRRFYVKSLDDCF